MALRFDQIELSGSSNGEKPVIQASGYSAQISTAYGYVSIGPANSSYSHFITDRGKYYFDKKIIVDQGIISSFNEDLHLKVNNDANTVMTLSKTSPYNVGIGTTSPTARLSVNGTTQLAGEVSLPSTGTATASVNYPSQTLRFTTSAWDTNNSVARDVHWNIRNEGTSTIYPDGTLAFYEESTSFNHWKLKLPGRGSGSTYIHPDAALFNGRVNIYESDTSNVNISLHPGGYSYFNGGNVGIGTTSPLSQFTVQSSDATAYDASVDSGQDSAGATIMAFNTDNTTTNSFAQILFRNRSSNVGVSRIVSLSTAESSTALAFVTENGNSKTEKMRIGPDGNVGIGTTDPDSILHVNGYRLRLGDGVSDSKLWGTPGTGGNFLIGQSSGTGKIKFVSNTDAALVTILNGGNVGIGTTSPNALLDVNGAGNFSGGTVVSGVDTQTSVGVSIAKGTFIKSNDGSYLRNIIGHGTTGNIEIGQTGTSLIGDVLILAGSSGNIRFYGNGSENMRVNSDGNVGIGTTNPQSSLHISGENAGIQMYDSTLAVGSDEVAIKMGNSSNYSSGIRSYIASGQPGVDRVNLGFHVTTYTSSLQSFYEAMTIKDNGNVGIGTTSPGEKLQVNGNIKFGGTTDKLLSSNGYAHLSFDVDGGFVLGDENYNYSGVFIKGDSNNYRTDFYVDATTVMRVGYSIDIPSYIRHLGDTNTRFGFSTNDTFLLQTAGSTRLYVNSTGNVGIGTTGPAYKLDVDGTIRATGDVIAFSDIRVKENIKTIDNALDKVKKLRGVEYNKIDSTEKSIGVIAQEIEEVVPEVVREDAQGMKSVAYGNITAVLIEAIKEQQKQIEELKSIINGSSRVG